MSNVERLIVNIAGEGILTQSALAEKLEISNNAITNAKQSKKGLVPKPWQTKLKILFPDKSLEWIQGRETKPLEPRQTDYKDEFIALMRDTNKKLEVSLRISYQKIKELELEMRELKRGRKIA